MILSVVMALVFRSPLALMMGVLGPLMVMGSWWEGIKRHRSSADRVEAEYDQSVSEYRERLDLMREETKTQALDVMPRLDHVFADPLGLGLPPRQSMIRVGTHWWTPPSSHPLAGTGGIAGMPFGVEAGAFRCLGTGSVAGNPRHHVNAANYRRTHSRHDGQYFAANMCSGE